MWSDEINHSNFDNATKCLNKSWWYLLKHASFILKLKDFCNTCVHFQWKKTNASRHIGILSALRMRGLHDKRQLLAKLRIAGSENSGKRHSHANFEIHSWHFDNYFQAHATTFNRKLWFFKIKPVPVLTTCSIIKFLHYIFLIQGCSW